MKPRPCMWLSPNFWLFFVALWKDFSLIHRLREELSTVWWKSFHFTHLREGPPKETLAAGRMSLEARINPCSSGTYMKRRCRRFTTRGHADRSEERRVGKECKARGQQEAD